MASFGYPVCLELGGRRCVVIGGGTVAEQKVRGLLDGGGDVVVIAGEVTPGLERLAGEGALEIVRRDYARGDLDGAFVAIAATDDPDVNAAVHEEGTAARVLVNSVDDIAHCHFSVPSTVRRGELTVAVSTGGKAPALSKKLRKTLSARLGPEYADLVEVVGEVRTTARPERARVDFETWAARWELGLDDDVMALVVDGRLDEARSRLLAVLAGDVGPRPLADGPPVGS